MSKDNILLRLVLTARVVEGPWYINISPHLPITTTTSSSSSVLAQRERESVTYLPREPGFLHKLAFLWQPFSSTQLTVR